MNTELLSDEKYEELLCSRTKPLTKNQIRQLRQIDRAEIFLNQYREELSDDHVNEYFTILRRIQMEILTNERDESWVRFLNSLPDEMKNTIDIF